MNIFDFTVEDGSNGTQPLAQYRGKVLLVVNVASRCGFTPQYEGLERLYRQYASEGLVVMGFPCNQFGHQEPGSNAEIQTFCALNYEVSFPVMAKVDVNGEAAAPVYRFLKSQAPGLLGSEAIKWNFTKFLVGRDGQTVTRYAPIVSPDTLVKDIETALKS